jgi:hypothetical protein
MATVASSWTQGKIALDPTSKRELRRREDRQRDRSTEVVACHECKDGKLRPLGGHGMCKRHYAAWRRTNNRGTCSVCGKPDKGLRRVRPPTCHGCAHAQWWDSLSEAEKAVQRAKDRRWQANKRRLHPGESTRREQRLKRDEPERYALQLEERRIANRQRRANETPEERELRLRARREKYARHDEMLREAGEQHRRRLGQLRPPEKTRVTSLSGYLHPDAEPAVKVTKIPVQTGLFANALAALREECPARKKYRARPPRAA